MEKSAKTIGRHKFSRLSSRRQHELLASLAGEALHSLDMEGFIKRYKELQSWIDLDRYDPPAWLTIEESLKEYRVFHANFSFVPDKPAEIDQPLSWQPKFAVEVVIDQIRSPYNVGSILRLLDNFSCKGMVHSTSWLRLDHPQLRKSARGCEQWIPVRFEPDLVSYLRKTSIPVIGIENDKEAVPINQWEPPEKCVLVLGNESYGIASAIRECCDRTVFIPMLGFKKSMNVHHALAIVAQKIVEKNKTNIL